MNARATEFTSATGGGPGGGPHAAAPHLAPATQ